MAGSDKKPPPSSKRRARPIVLAAPAGWRSRPIAIVAVAVAALIIPLLLTGLSSSLAWATTTLSIHPTWSIRQIREAEDLGATEMVKREQCFVPLPSGRLVITEKGGRPSEDIEVAPVKPYVMTETPRQERGKVGEEIDALREGEIDQDRLVAGKCFALTATGRLIDVTNRVELMEFGPVAETNGLGGALMLMFLFVVAGVVPIFLTVKPTWATAFIAALSGALVQGLLWGSQVHWGARDVLMRPTLVGAASVPTGLFMVLFLLVLVAAATLANSFVTAIRYAVMGAMPCRDCHAVFTAPVTPERCPACNKAIPRTKVRPLIAVATAVVSTMLLVAFVQLFGDSLGFYIRCPAGDPGGTCSYFLRQHPGITQRDLGRTIIMYDSTLYLVYTAIAFLPAPLLVARLLPSARSTALLGAALAWIPASIVGAFLLASSTDPALLGSLVIFHFKALAPWVIPGCIGAFVGYALRTRSESALANDLESD